LLFEEANENNYQRAQKLRSCFNTECRRVVVPVASKTVKSKHRTERCELGLKTGNAKGEFVEVEVLG